MIPKDICTWSDLLEALRDKGIREINEYSYVKHPTTIGDMYEGLTREITEKALFVNLNLQVVSGQIRNTAGLLSKQIDCMVVFGQGEKLPNTERYIYPLKQVLMVIEVKKTLYSADLKEAYANIQSVINLHDANVDQINASAFFKGFNTFTGRDLKDPKYFSDCNSKEKALCHLLIAEQILPLKVIWGYNGFNNEISLREKFNAFITNQLDVTCNKFEPFRLPDLVVVGDNSLVKTNGMPYSIHINDKYDYCWISSYRRTPVLILLELLWTRLQLLYNLSPSIFGEYIKLESIAPFCLIKYNNKWEYDYIDLTEESIARYDAAF